MDPSLKSEHRYCHEHDLDLDLWLPEGRVRAVVLYLYGGGFRKGSRKGAVAPALARRLLPEGYAVAAADYRLNTGFDAFDPADALEIAQMRARSAKAGLTLSPSLCGPAFVAALLDVSKAMLALRSGSLAASTKDRPLAIVGVSAGGIAALSLAYPPGFFADRLARPDAVIAIAAAMVQPWRLAPDGAPSVLFHGNIDRVIGPENPRLAARRARGVGAPLRLVETGIAGHNTQLTAFMDGLDPSGRPWFDTLTDMLEPMIEGADLAVP